MFDAPLFNGPRTWKYALPGFLVVALLPVIGKMMISPDPEIRYWAMLPIGFCGVLIIMFLVNLWKYMSEHAMQMFDEHQSALSRTPLVMLAEAMKQMHPDAVKVLNRFGVRTSWEVRLNAQTYERDWLLSGTNAHFGFVEHVLSRSGKALFPKRSFAEGSKKWDPDGVVEDREQYDDLERWLFARMIVTRSHGDFKPAEFLPPWTPDLALEAMGLTGEQDLYRPDEEARRDLGAISSQQSAVSGQRSARPIGQSGQQSANGNGQKPPVEPELSDAEWQVIQNAIQKENDDYQNLLNGAGNKVLTHSEQNLKGESQ